jgi:pimeloyl-ACP methyl ester carboxylesterase
VSSRVTPGAAGPSALSETGAPPEPGAVSDAGAASEPGTASQTGAPPEPDTVSDAGAASADRALPGARAASMQSAAAINHRREGTGPPLVLLHGIGHHWQAWRPVMDLLRGEFDLIACDSPGFGRSTPLPPTVDPTIPAYVDSFERFFDELSLERPHVAGNSMGGAIALELARRGAVRSATALSPAGFWSPRERRYCQLSLTVMAGVPRPLRPPIAVVARTRPGRVALLAQLAGWPARMPASETVSALTDLWGAPAMTGALAAFDGFSFARSEQPWKVPVTVAWGARDRLLPCSRQAPRARMLMPWARHLTLGAGHLPCYDDPGAVAETIRSCALGPGT